MSGIAAIIHFDGCPVAPGQIEAMTSAMAYRGPDGISHWRFGHVALGHCQLRTTPESLEERQPLANEDASLVLVMDGRVDNWLELRQMLLAKGAKLRNRSDAELVLRAYEIWGRDCLNHIDGDFAWVLWDERRREAFCARDKIGNKPFHYYWDGKTLLIASEINAILALPSTPREPNLDMLAEFLAAEWHSRDETLWRGVMRLVAAHCLVADGRRPVPEKYWQPDLWATLPYHTDEEFIEHYRELIFDSVRRLSRSHRPLATEVSGGLDSSGVFCVAERLRREGRLQAPELDGYTLAFLDDPRVNDLEYARIVGRYSERTINEVEPTSPPLSWYEASARQLLDCPPFPNGTMLFGVMDRAVSKGSRVILNGIGGDEWLDGSRAYYAEELQQRQWRRLREHLRTDAALFGKSTTLKWFIRHGLMLQLPITVREGLLHARRRLLGIRDPDPFWLAPELKKRLQHRRQRGADTVSQRLRCAGQEESLRTLETAVICLGREQGERLYATRGLEVRRPLFTAAYVQFAFSTPERLRLRGDRSRFIHVQALRGILPDEIRKRRNKAEFSGAIRLYLANPQPMLSRISTFERKGWLQPGASAAIHETCYKNQHLGWPLWTLWSIYGCANVITDL